MSILSEPCGPIPSVIGCHYLSNVHYQGIQILKERGRTTAVSKIQNWTRHKRTDVCQEDAHDHDSHWGPLLHPPIPIYMTAHRIIEYQLYVNSSAPDKNCCWLNRSSVCPQGGVSDMSMRDIDLTSIQLTKTLTTRTGMLLCIESYSNILFWWKRALTNLHCPTLLHILKRSPHNTSEVNKWTCLVSWLF